MNKKSLYRKFFLFPIAAVLILALVWLIQSKQYCGWDFHNSLWGPVNLLIHGQTPYTLNPPYGPYPGVWMPQGLGMFFWFGLFPCTISASFWVVFELGGFIWVIWAINDFQRPSPWALFICLLALFLYPPLWVHIHLGQFSMLFVILMIMSVYLPGARRWIPLLLAVGLTKPQLSILVYPGIFVYTWHQKGFRQAVGLVVSTMICITVLTVPLFILHPGWPADFLFITTSNFQVHWDLPTLFVQLPALIGQAGYLVWGVALLVTMCFSLWLWLTQDKKTAMVFSLALTPMVTTYASSWDFMLLVPAFYWLVLKIKTRWARVVLLIGMLLVYWLQYAARLHQSVRDGSQWWIPPVMSLVLLGSLLIEHAKRLPFRKPAETR